MTDALSKDSSSQGGVTVRAIVTGPVQENTLLMYDEAGRGFIVDPGDDARALLREVRAAGMTPQAILLTHAHFDHVGAVQPLREALGIPVYAHPAGLSVYRQAAGSAARFGVRVPQPADPDEVLSQDQELRAGNVRLKVRELFGHAPGHVVLLGDGFVIAGDTLFQGSVGRTDLPGGNHQELLGGIERELLTLPDDTRVYPGHGPATTVGRERQHNPYL